ELGLQESITTPQPRHRVLVLVDDLNRSTLAALQYARQLRPLSTTALHAAVDPRHAVELQTRWGESRVPFDLEIITCPERDADSAASLSRISFSCCRRAVTSRTTAAAPATAPPSVTRDTVNSIEMRPPSFRSAGTARSWPAYFVVPEAIT